MVLLVVLALGLLTALTLWKWLDIRSLEELQKVVSSLLSGNGQHYVSNLFQVDEKSTRHGGELAAAVLKAHGVQEIFVLCGGHISPILVASEKLGIRIVDTRHEVTTVFAADAVARLRQSIGVAAVTAGPGLTNTITAVKNAQMAESPLLLIGGAAPSLLKGRGALQDIDQLVLFRPLCKYAARVERLRDIVPTLQRALQAAQSGTPGPVFVEFPIDVLYPYQLVVKEIGFVPNPAGFVPKVVNAYLMAHVSRQFGGAWNKQEITPLNVHTPLAQEKDLAQLVELIAKAKRPLILLGSQATLPPVKPTDLAKTIESLGIPVFLGGMSRGLLGRSHNLQMRHTRKDALREADLVILAGTVADFRLSYGRVLPKRAALVSINRNREQLFKNEGIFWKARLALQADVASTILEVASRLVATKRVPDVKEWVQQLRTADDAKETANELKMTQRTLGEHLNPLSFLSKLERSLPDDVILVADGGDFVGSAAYIVKPRGPLQWLDPGAFGTLGVGGGFALGAKVVHPDKPVLILWGDGSSGYSIMELDTAKRHKLPLVAVIGNDGCWTQIARDQVPMFGSTVATLLDRANYHAVAQALGADGQVVDASNESNTESIIRSAIDGARGANGRSSVLNAHIGKTDFREGSISV